MPVDSVDGHLELVCPACSNAVLCTPTEMLVRLRGLGMLKRAADPSLEEILQLFLASTERMQCTQCQSLGLVTRDAVPEPDEWDDSRTRYCVFCKKPIPPERIGIFPDVTACASCQSREDSTGNEEPEYCPRCGDITVIRQQSGSGTTHYVLYCPTCRR